MNDAFDDGSDEELAKLTSALQKREEQLNTISKAAKQKLKAVKTALTGLGITTSSDKENIDCLTQEQVIELCQELAKQTPKTKKEMFDHLNQVSESKGLNKKYNWARLLGALDKKKKLFVKHPDGSFSLFGQKRVQSIKV